MRRPARSQLATMLLTGTALAVAVAAQAAETITIPMTRAAGWSRSTAQAR